MKTIEQTYKVELNVDEVRAIADSLHAEYLKFRHAYESATSQDAPKIYKDVSMLRTLRNSFANIIGRSYMGEDA